jgi:cytidylate kinase
VEDGMALAELARSSTIEFGPSPQGVQVLLDGRDVTGDIRSPEVTAHVSQVAAQAELRRELMRLQRLLALEGCTVVDGRDIGTCVVPEAGLKVFLTAEFQTRVERRHAELLERGFEVTAAEVAQNMAARDKLDSGREVAPLQKAKDAVVVDTTGLSIAEVVQRVVDECRVFRSGAR